MTKLSYIAAGFVIFISLCNSIAFGEESRSAFRIGRSGSDYAYYAKGQVCTPEATGDKLRFTQSDYEVGIDTPKNYFGGFYINAGVNFTTLTQDEQAICSFSGSEKGQVPEKAFLHLRELLVTVGKEFGFFSIDVSLGQMNVKGNYYLNNIRYGTEGAFVLVKVNGALQFDLFNWGKMGAELSATTNPPQDGDDYQENGYIEYVKGSIFLKILL